MIPNSRQWLYKDRLVRCRGWTAHPADIYERDQPFLSVGRGNQ